MMRANRPLPLLTDSIFIVLALYFVFIYTRSIFVFPQLQTSSFLVYQTLFLLFQLVALGLFLARKEAVLFSSKIVDYVYTLVALGSPMFFQPVFGVGVSIVGESLEFAGAILVIGGFLSLNRSFGIAPENRGIKTKGMYRIVRHPMYSGYILTETGFVLNNLSLFNVIILATVIFFLVLRLQAEERLLREDSAYQAYAQKTSWKLIPFVF
jgi:protein-S-isoprenylcysteine O-methyltransferase Ste14